MRATTSSSIVGASSSNISAVREEFYECNYEENCTPLYKALERAIIEESVDYNGVSDFLETGQWPDGSLGDAPHIQARTWVTRFNPDDHHVEWSQLPLHLAIVGGAPSYIIGSLVKLYPQALRCTDDQQMLPLHLALRHGADDEVVAYLLMQFPEAVHARGKNGRTAIECALRAKDKLRGIILEAFVEKTKSRLTASLEVEKQQLSDNMHELMNKLKTTENQLSEKSREMENHEKTILEFEATKSAKNKLEIDLKMSKDEVKTLKAELHDQNCEFESLKSIRNNLKKEMKERMEEFVTKLAENEKECVRKVEKLNSEKLREIVELETKIQALQKSKSELETSEKRLKLENVELRNSIEELTNKVQALQDSTEDLQKVKAEILQTGAERLESMRILVKEAISLLHADFERTVRSPRQLEVVQKTVDKLQETGDAATTTDELNDLRYEVENLREKIRERSETDVLVTEIDKLRIFLEGEIKNISGLDKSEAATIRTALNKAKISTIKSKASIEELKFLKTQMEEIKVKLHAKELAERTKVNVDELERAIEVHLAKDGELAGMRKAVESIRAELANNHSRDILIEVNKDVERLKEEIARKEITSHIMSESSALKEAIDNEREQHKASKVQKEFKVMKQNIKSIADGISRDVTLDQLAEIKAQIGEMKKEFKELLEVTRAQKELETMKKTLEKEIQSAGGKTEKELLEMKKAVDAINLEHCESKKLKETLADEIQKANAETEKELVKIKESLGAIDFKKVMSKNRHDWESMRNELENLKTEMKKKQEVKFSNTEKELKTVKETIANIAQKQESKQNDQYENLKKELETLKSSIQKKEQEEVAMQRMIDELKGDLTVKAATSPRKPSRLVRFFPTLPRFRRRNVDVLNEINEIRTGVHDGLLSPISTMASMDPSATKDLVICPPSLHGVVRMQSLNKRDEDEESSDDEAPLPPALEKIKTVESRIEPETKNMGEETISLHRTLSKIYKQEGDRVPTVNAASVKALPTFNVPKPKARFDPQVLKKVQSIGPGAYVQSQEFKNGEIELEAILCDYNGKISAE
jgi:DNA repair exonuclease SbcCD ATPase subunit